MEEVYIKVKGTVIEKLFEKDLVSVDDLVAKIEDQMYDIEELKEKIDDMKEAEMYE